MMQLFNQKLSDYDNLFDWSVPLELCSSFNIWNLLSATSIVDILLHKEIYFLLFAFQVAECFQFEW